MRKDNIILIVLMTLLAAFFLCSQALAGPADEEKLRNWFEGQNISPIEVGKAARVVTNDELFPLVNKEYFKNVSDKYKLFNPLAYTEYLSLAYGDRYGTFDLGEYRYIGYTNKDEAFVNFWFRPDFVPGGGFHIDKARWIANPRKDDRVIEFVAQMGESSLEDNPFLPSNPMVGSKLRPYITWGLKALAIAWPQWYKFDEAASAIQDWENYVHILQPPSHWCFGTGRMFHQARDGSIWYLDVPLPPGFMLELDLKAELEKDGYQGKPGEVINTTATFSLNKEYIFPVTARLRLYIETENDIIELPFTPVDQLKKVDGGKYTFQPGESLAVKISFSAPGVPAELVARIDPVFEEGRIIVEKDSDNNEDRAPITTITYDIKVEVVSDKYVFESFGGAKAFVPMKIFVTRKDTVPGDIQAELSVSGPVASYTKTITLPPGGQYVARYEFGADPGSYTLSAEAWPVGSDDAYPEDNRDAATVTVKNVEMPKPDSGILPNIIDNGPIYSR